jgi:hypothetical protein
MMKGRIKKVVFIEKIHKRSYRKLNCSTLSFIILWVVGLMIGQRDRSRRFHYGRASFVLAPPTSRVLLFIVNHTPCRAHQTKLSPHNPILVGVVMMMMMMMMAVGT